ncbi:MAG: hypothetical protein ABMA13_18090 [Chthoniobacteraceae bacterium]
MSETTAMLEIRRSDFTDAVKPLLKIARPRKGEEAVLSFDGSFLVIELGGGGVGVPAKGIWPGQARVVGEFVTSLMKAPPVGNPIVFKIMDGRIFAGSASIGCAWQAAEAKKIELPVNATPLNFLRISETYTDEEIRDAGLHKLIKLAREGRDEKVARAAHHLASLGITADDLREFIRKRVLGEKAR